QKISYFVLLCDLHKVPSPDHVIFYSFEYMTLHHWYVLVRSCVINRLYGMSPDYFLKSIDIPNVAHNRNDLQIRLRLLQLLVDLKQLTFCLIQQDELARTKLCSLATEL